MPDTRALPPDPANEAVRAYQPDSPETAALQSRLDAMAGETIEAPCVIEGRSVTTGRTFRARAPHDHGLTLANVHGADRDEVIAAVEAARSARHDWMALDWRDRAAIFLKAADLIAGPHRDTLNAATMLNQSKTVQQAEIDAACELIDFLRFNAHFYAEILAGQPHSARGVWNQVDYRPLDGFVLALTPFNFTAIAGNLPTAPALCGNTVVWKASEKQALSAHYLMTVLQEAGLPDGVINLVHGDGALAADVCTDQDDFAGLHFTGSVTVFRGLWRTIGSKIDRYIAFPRIVGETGGKDFIAVHRSADPAAVVTALVRGAFEYQGQKCSAASRAYVPHSLWDLGMRDRLADTTAALTMGDVRDWGNFMGAVIDEAAFRRHETVLHQAAHDPTLEVLVGGGTDEADGWFVEPTVVVTSDPRHELMATELFGPILTVFVYEDDDWSHVLDLVDTTSPYALTGAVFATDRNVIADASIRLRHAAGNFYVNDKPTGAIVGQQPFGGSRSSGTNDKAGAPQNLLRWMSTRALKEAFDPPRDHRYPHMG